MLAIGTDCAGLTLVAANHLFLIDAALSAGSVAQLIGRIARQGQTRPACFVYHLAVRRSIEERVLRLRASVRDPSAASSVAAASVVGTASGASGTGSRTGTGALAARASQSSSTEGLSTADLFYLLDDGIV